MYMKCNSAYTPKFVGASVNLILHERCAFRIYAKCNSVSIYVIRGFPGDCGHKILQCVTAASFGINPNRLLIVHIPNGRVNLSLYDKGVVIK
jgi:hypothetical protein